MKVPVIYLSLAAGTDDFGHRDKHRRSYNRNRNRKSSSTPLAARPTSNSKWQEQELVQDQTQIVIQMP